MTILAITTALMAAAAALGNYEWTERTLPEGATLLAPGPDVPFSAVRVANAKGRSRTVTLLQIDRPPVQTMWHFTGQVRYADVEGDGYLELLNYFPGYTGPFFSRTVSPGGLLRKLSGTSDWRPFMLPFDASSGGDPPTRLVVNVVLPGSGTVDVGPIELHAGLGDRAAWTSGGAGTGAWWGDRTAGLVFGSLGGVFGTLCAIITALARKGRARQAVFSAWYLMTSVGAASLLAGLAALTMRQPYAVYYPLLLSGVIALVVLGPLYRTLLRSYEARELRRMSAMDTR